MIQNDAQIVWTPALTATGVTIFVRSSFARKCFHHVLRNHFEFANNVRASMDEKEVLGYDWFRPLPDARLLPHGLYKPRGGVWLTTYMNEVTQRLSSGKPIVYYSHNCDNTTDRESLLRMFGAWAMGASFELEKK